MAMKLYNETDIQNIADAIREKNGTQDTYTISEMATAISEISSDNYYIIQRYVSNLNQISVSPPSDYPILYSYGVANGNWPSSEGDWNTQSKTYAVGNVVYCKASGGGYLCLTVIYTK